MKKVQEDQKRAEEATRSSVGPNIARIRKEKGLSLSGLAERSGVGKATLSMIEGGQSNPTISTVWAIADGLGVPFSQILGEAPGAEVYEGGASVRFIDRSEEPPWMEAFSLHFGPGVRRDAAPHEPGVKEKLVVLKGPMLVGPKDAPSIARTGDSVTFSGDSPHVYAALDKPAVALLLVEYPDHAAPGEGTRVVVRTPRRSDDWDVVHKQLRRACVQTGNGLSTVRLQFEGTVGSADEEVVRSRLKSLLQTVQAEKFGWPVKGFHVLDESVGSIVLFKWPRAPHGQSAVSRSSAEEALQCPDRADLKQAAALSSLAQDERVPVSDDALFDLRQKAQQPKLSLATLAAEILTQRGEATVPERFRAEGGGPELLQPAYARQVVELAMFLERRRGSRSGDGFRWLDAGGRSALPLHLLAELFPKTSFISVRAELLPSQQIDPARIELLEGDFLDFAGRSPVSVITSMDAPQELHPAFLFQKAHALLEKEGLLLTAGRLVGPYTKSSDRELQLIAHHGAYILATLLPANRPEDELLNEQERAFSRLISTEVPLAVHEADTGDIGSAVPRCRRLLRDLNAISLPPTARAVRMEFHRFHVSELKSLVAGLDCEEESTYPQRLLELASLTGFELLGHRRVYATVGDSPLGAGSHVFAFRKK